MSALRIDLVAPPFAGHLHPLLGLGRRLQREHEVRVLSTERAQPEIAAAGLAGVVLLAGRDDEVQAIADPPHRVGGNPLRLHDQLRRNLALLDQFQHELGALWRTAPPHLLIADFTLPVAGTAARRLGIPWWTTHPSPCVIETPDGPPAYLGGWLPGRGPLGRLRDAAGRRLVRVFKRLVHRLHRGQMTRLGLPAIYRPDGSEAVYSPQRILALGLRELELPRRWPASVSLVGPILYTPPSNDDPPPLRPGRPQVLITLGTHLRHRKEAMAAAARRAAAALPHLDVTFTDGDRRDARLASDGNFHRRGHVAYDPCLPRYDLVVHHGGAGVMYHTLAAGRPAVVHPCDYDQADHAARLGAAGLAHRLPSLDGLAPAIERALGDHSLAAACAAFAPLVQRAQAAEKIAALVSALGASLDGALDGTAGRT